MYMQRESARDILRKQLLKGISICYEQLDMDPQSPKLVEQMQDLLEKGKIPKKFHQIVQDGIAAHKKLQ